MTPRTTAVWRKLPKDLAVQLAACCRRANDASSDPTAVFFRADDVAVPGRQFRRLMEIFTRNEVPLVPGRGTRLVDAAALAGAFPAWGPLGRSSGAGISTAGGTGTMNKEGKKQEFGPSRSHDALRTDLDRGRRRLTVIMGAAFCPLFTPPWNRCSEITLALLQEMGV